MAYETLNLVTLPPVEPVDVATLRAWVRQDSDVDDDELSSLITSARIACESYLKRSFVQAQYDWTLDFFPGRNMTTPLSLVYDARNFPLLFPYFVNQAIVFPASPLASVDSVKYYDVTGTLTTLDPSKYVVTLGSPGRLSMAPGQSYPTTQSRIGAVVIRFTSGYSADATSVPENVKTAIKLLAAHWYRNRESVVVGTIATELPVGYRALLHASATGFYV